MAGNYPDVPGHRMAWDRDGTILCLVAGSITILDASTRNILNDDTGSHFFQTSDAAVCLIFPEKRDIVGMYVACGDGVDTFSAAWSANTTNGLDGTWTSFAFTRDTGTGSETQFRNNIRAVNLAGVKAVRVQRGNIATFPTRQRIGAFHVYGSPSVGEAPNRLRLWHPTLDQEVTGSFFDWGDVTRGTTSQRDFRVKNNSATQTANSVMLTMEALTDTSPSNVGQHTFSLDGTTFTSSTIVGDLAPGAISPTVRLRRTTTTDAALSLWWTRIVASAASWA